MGCCKSCQQQISISNIAQNGNNSSRNNTEELIFAKNVYNSRNEIMLKYNQQISEDSDTLFNISQEIQDIRIHENVRNCSLPYQFQEFTEVEYKYAELQSDFQKQKKHERNSQKIKNSQFYSPQIQKRELYINMLDITFYDYDSKNSQQQITSILKRNNLKQNSRTDSSKKKVKFAKGTSFKSKSASPQKKKINNKSSFRQVFQINQ